VEARIDDLYQLETLCNGRPIAETRAQLGRLPEWYRYNASLLVADRTDVIPRMRDRKITLE
jgi:phenylacetaldehyde dehydrogenase